MQPTWPVPLILETLKKSASLLLPFASAPPSSPDVIMKIRLTVASGALERSAEHNSWLKSTVVNKCY